MKFEQQEPEFRPVVITLESEMEVMILAAALGKTSNEVNGHENFLFNLYQGLNEVSDYAETLESIKTLTGIRVREL